MKRRIQRAQTLTFHQSDRRTPEPNPSQGPHNELLVVLQSTHSSIMVHPKFSSFRTSEDSFDAIVFQLAFQIYDDQRV